MSLSQIKKEFVKKLISGLHDLMNISELANRIGISPRNDTEHFIKKHFLVQNDDGSFMVNKVNFRMGLTSLDFDDLVIILLHLDSIGITLKKVYDQSVVDVLCLNGEEMNYIHLINDNDIVTFKDFILY
ncbi:hypothetical protein CL646_02595 [bacterium]|nr:hypothetical protein [bacterium]|tara:strand:- start:252 stop:638 length:387 start_codon:yes stop_codon:yes gene_type:complete